VGRHVDKRFIGPFRRRRGWVGHLGRGDRAGAGGDSAAGRHLLRLFSAGQETYPDGTRRKWIESAGRWLARRQACCLAKPPAGLSRRGRPEPRVVEGGIAGSAGGSWILPFGDSTMTPVPTDYDGDGARTSRCTPRRPAPGASAPPPPHRPTETFGGPLEDPVLLLPLIQFWSACREAARSERPRPRAQKTVSARGRALDILRPDALHRTWKRKQPPTGGNRTWAPKEEKSSAWTSRNCSSC
jgi:hypothetical protein